MALVQGAGFETEVWHLPFKVPEVDWSTLKPTGRQVDAPAQVQFKLEATLFTLARGDEAEIPSSLVYALPSLAPQLVKGPAPKSKAG